MSIRELYKEKSLELRAALQAFKDMKQDYRDMQSFKSLQFELFQLKRQLA
jgi:hypothetical protein